MTISYIQERRLSHPKIVLPQKLLYYVVFTFPIRIVNEQKKEKKKKRDLYIYNFVCLFVFFWTRERAVNK